MNNTDSQPLDKKTFWLGVSAVIFAVLIAAHVIPEQTATAAESIEGRDYSMATALAADGSDVVYILDKRTGTMALVEWDAQAKIPVVRTRETMQNAFR